MTRGKYEIYRDILACCYKGETKSRLMTKCRLSWSQIGGILPFLTNEGFLDLIIERKGKRRCMKVYRTTQKGVVLLMALENVEFILKTEYARKVSANRHVATATTQPFFL